MASINVTGVGLREGVKMKQTSSYLKRLSKAATPGGQYRLFFTKIKGEDGVEDIMAAAATGRSLDFNIFGSSFMTYANDWWEGDAAGGKKDLMGLDSYARIARIIFEAQCEQEKARAQEEADQMATQNGGQRDEIALLRKLDKIDEKYHGREGGEGVQRTYGTVSPAIRGLATQIIVELLMVPMDSTTNTPQWEKAEYVYKEFSKKIMNTFIQLLDNPAYNDPSKPYLEVSFTYGAPNQNAKQAGQDSSYNGVSSNLGLETMFADSWNSIGKAKVDGIAGGKKTLEEAGPIILAHSGYTQGRMTPQDVDAKLRQWVASNLVILTHINMGDPNTQRGAADLIKSGLVDNISQIKTKLEELITDENASVEVTPMPAPVDTAPAPAPAPAPTSDVTSNAVAETMAGGSGVTLDSLMQNNATPAPASTGVDLDEGGVAMREAVTSNVPEDEEELGDLL